MRWKQRLPSHTTEHIHSVWILHIRKPKRWC